jgi:hypothetical protein
MNKNPRRIYIFIGILDTKAKFQNTFFTARTRIIDLSQLENKPQSLLVGQKYYLSHNRDNGKYHFEIIK